MKNIRILFTTMALVIFSIHALCAQDVKNNNRVGLEVGYPYLIGLDYEYNFKNHGRFSINSNISYFKYDKSNLKGEMFTLNFGPRYYLLKNFKGLFTGLNLGYISYSDKSFNLILHDEISNTDYSNGTTELSFKAFVINPNIGYRAIKGHFTVCPQIGLNVQNTLAYSYKEYADVYLKEKDKSNLNSKFLIRFSIYISIGIAF